MSDPTKAVTIKHNGTDWVLVHPQAELYMGNVNFVAFGNTSTYSYITGSISDLQLGTSAVPNILTIGGGAAKVKDGSASAPTWSFQSDTNTGFYSAGADQIGVAVGGSNAGTWSSNGLVPTGSTYPKVQAYASGQTLTSGGAVDTLALTEIIDTASAFASNTFTVPANAGGTYQISLANLQIAGGSDSVSIRVLIYKNGSESARLDDQNYTSAVGGFRRGSLTLDLVASDAITIRVRQADGSAATIDSGSTFGRLSIHRVF